MILNFFHLTEAFLLLKWTDNRNRSNNYCLLNDKMWCVILEFIYYVVNDKNLIRNEDIDVMYYYTFFLYLWKSELADYPILGDAWNCITLVCGRRGNEWCKMYKLLLPKLLVSGPQKNKNNLSRLKEYCKYRYNT